MLSPSGVSRSTLEEVLPGKACWVNTCKDGPLGSHTLVSWEKLPTGRVLALLANVCGCYHTVAGHRVLPVLGFGS